MAIAKYISETTNPSAFVTWFNENKTGTVLENLTASYTTISSGIPNYMTTLTDGTNTLTIETWGESNTKATSSATYSFIIFNSSGVCTANINSTGSSYSSIVLRPTLLCKHGLILGIRGKTGSNSSYATNTISYHTPLLLTVDNNGDLTVITPYKRPICGYMTSGYVNRGTYVSVEINGYRMKPGLLDECSGIITGISSNYATSLQHFTSYETADGTGHYTPFAYYSIVEQFTPDDQSTVGVVMLNNKKYITNGRWYIQDDD